MRILHLAANRWWTGSADPTIRLVAGLRARGHRVLLGAIPGDRFETKAREAGLELVGVLRLDPRAGPAALARDALRLRALVRAEAVDVIHAHHSHDHWLAMLARPRRGAGGRPPGRRPLPQPPPGQAPPARCLEWLARRRRGAGGRPPVVRTFHNLRAVKRDQLSARLYRRTAAALVVSRQIEVRCREVGFGAERVVWLPGVADLGRFAAGADPRPVREEFALGDAPVIVSVARLAPNRSHELLLDGFRLLLGTLPQARLLLVGKGEARDRLEARVAALGLGDRVVFTGYRDRDLPEVLAAADCFVLMAAGSDESCRAALEAMAAARPVVARRVGALPETVVDGETGLLLGEDEPVRVAEALLGVLADRARGRAMGAAGRRRAEAEFGLERSVEIVEVLYRRLA